MSVLATEVRVDTRPARSSTARRGSPATRSSAGGQERADEPTGVRVSREVVKRPPRARPRKMGDALLRPSILALAPGAFALPAPRPEHERRLSGLGHMK